MLSITLKIEPPCLEALTVRFGKETLQGSNFCILFIYLLHLFANHLTVRRLLMEIHLAGQHINETSRWFLTRYMYIHITN